MKIIPQQDLKPEIILMVKNLQAVSHLIARMKVMRLKLKELKAKVKVSVRKNSQS
jgi:hypothetical protein